MNSLSFPSKLGFSVLGLVCNLLVLQCSASSNVSWYKNCGTYFSCGTNMTDVGYPFWGGARPKDCGYPGLKLTCKDSNVTVMEIMGQKYQVLGINKNDQTINILREDIATNGICLKEFVTTTLDFSLFDYTTASLNLTILYACPSSGYGYGHSDPTQFTCGVNGSNNTRGYIMYGSVGLSVKGCYRSVVVPVMASYSAEFQAGNLGAEALIAKGFEVKYKVESQACESCSSSNGRCGYDLKSNTTTCICADGRVGLESCGYNETTSSSSIGKGSKKGTFIGISIGVVLAILLLLLGGGCLFARRRQKQLVEQEKSRGIFPTPVSSNDGGGPPASTPGSNGLRSSHAYTTASSTYSSHSNASYMSSRSKIGKTYNFGVHVFDYTELEIATNNFDESKELGDGGFGTVYYGVLQDGRCVAVKRLYENSAKRKEQFKNEIKILATLEHRNLVRLYGCTSSSSRDLLLVYEFIANGTVAEHLHGKFSESTFLRWPTRLNIAVETAEALTFLHGKGVIHRDVKTTNILLDDGFHVKVADFGLSRLFSTDMTHVSTAPQGTPGYVDPEYYQCYRLTEKSDVYSFGVVLIELISSKLAVDITRHRHDVNLASMAVDRIQNQALHELVDPRLEFDKDPAVQAMVRMVAELGFQCLQPDREMRPTMDEVVARLRAVQLEGVKDQQKQEVLDIIVHGDDVGLLTNPTTPLSPELPRSNDVV